MLQDCKEVNRLNRTGIILLIILLSIMLIAGVLFLIADNKNSFLIRNGQDDSLSPSGQIDYKTTESDYNRADKNKSLVDITTESSFVDKTTEKSKSNNNGNTTIKKDISNTQLMTILFLGIDRTEERDESIGIFRSDTIMIARIDVAKNSIKILSIPRDTYAYIPLIDKKDKINHAYAYGSLKGKGVISVIDAIEQFTEKPKIENYFLLEMEPIPDIIDDLGGIELDVEIDMKTHGADLSKGYQILDGKKAFDYIHWRYSSSGDIGRIERQHKFIKTLFNKINNSEEPEQLINILLKYIDYYDTNLALEQIRELINSIQNIQGEDIQFFSIPGKDKTIDGIWYWEPNPDDTEKVLVDFYK